MNPIQLVAEGYPVGLHIVRSTEELDLSRSWREPLDHAVDLVRLVARGTHLPVTRDKDLTLVCAHVHVCV